MVTRATSLKAPPLPGPAPDLTGLPGLDPAWSRTVEVPGSDGVRHTWHLLDSEAGSVVGDGSPDQPTLLCVHGNPTWSYLWRRMFAAAPPGWRVIAPDQLGMGYSERLPAPRTLAERVRDLGALTAALGITGPVVTLAHDWGGIISLGWALEHRAQVRGVVLTNTAVHQPEDSRPPALIRLAHLRMLRDSLCVRTPVFVRSATALSWPPLPSEVRGAFAAPYHGARRRRSVGDFVADIPFGEDDPSRPALDVISGGIKDLDVPALLLWGPRDPVFGEQYLRDLLIRLPRADVHRYAGASHLLPEDAPRYAEDVARWLHDLDSSQPAAAGDADTVAQADTAAPSVWQALVDRAARTPDEIATAEVGGASITWAELNRRVRDTAAGLANAGVAPGQRVALLVPPSIELTVAVYSVWRAGAVIVVADKGLGLRGMGRALRGARVDHVIGTAQGLAAARAMRLPGTRWLAGTGWPAGTGSLQDGAAPAAERRLLGVRETLAELAAEQLAADEHPLPEVTADAEAAVVFTSGATGPAKGVLYLHRQVHAQLHVVRQVYGLTDEDRMVAAFAPFALFGPALGVASAVPAADVTKPGTLTAAALADAALAVEATVVFASPAALRNVAATAGELTPGQLLALGRVRLLMSAGAPVPLELLRQVAELMPVAEAHTPYGMTELLPVTDVSMREIEQAGQGDGVCVGRAVPGVDIAISELDGLARDVGELTSEPGVVGEICVRAEHGKQRYDGLWATERASSRDAGWHRTGDVGHLDGVGRLWVQGRRPHLITTPQGLLTPVGLEQRVEAVTGIGCTAVVGVGPAGTQQVVVIVVPSNPPTSRRRARRGRVADLELSAAVRAAVDVPVAAVLVRDALPVDIRHASKVDRTALAGWAEKVLAGRS